MEEDRQRVSCAGLCRIQNEKRQYLLILNEAHKKAGHQVYTPIGGGWRFAGPFSGLKTLMQLRAIPQALIKFPPRIMKLWELRLYVPTGELPHFEDWFQAREGREVTPFRELREELKNEAKIWPRLNEEDVTITYVRDRIFTALSENPRTKGELTRFCHEIFDVHFHSAELWQALLEARPESGLIWVTAEQIRSRRVNSAAISANSLLDTSEV